MRIKKITEKINGFLLDLMSLRGFGLHIRKGDISGSEARIKYGPTTAR